MKICNFVQVSALMLCFISCTNTKKTLYFADQPDATLLSNTPVPQSFIQSNDLLSIYVSTANPVSAAVFNTPNQTTATTNAASGAQLQSSGYLVNAEGYIQYPIIGNVKAKGLTTMQLKEQLTKTLLDRKLLVDPVLSVRQLNFRVSVLGEVNHPTVVNAPNEQITLLEALGLAGDITIYGRKDNVMVIRQENDQKIIKRLNLNSSDLLTSPYFYLKSNDIVYVEPGKSRVFGTSRTNQLLPIILSGLSLVVIIVTNIK